MAGGRVVGVWERDETVTVTLFPEAGEISRAEVAAEADRLAEGAGPVVVKVSPPARS